MKIRATTFRKRFQTAIKSIPAPGNGCHVQLLGVANLGVRCNLSDDEIVDGIAAGIPAGSRTVPRSEIQEAVAKARRDADGDKPAFRPSPTRPLFDGPTARAALIARTGPVDPDRMRAENGIDWPVEEDGRMLLRRLYAPDEFVFLGSKYDVGADHVRPVRDWLLDDAGLDANPHIIANPLCGETRETANGKPSMRCDACVAGFRYAVAEFDDLPLPEQLAIWRGLRLPIVALIDSGGKSVHAWIRVPGIDSNERWSLSVEQGLYSQLLVPLGVDSACRNEARLSRFPGALRAETGRFQHLLFLAETPEGGRP